MNLTPQQLRDRADAIEAHEAGKPVQYLNNGVWTLSEYPPRMWNFDMHYRPAPAPAPPRPWDCADDVPGPVCYVKSKDIRGLHRHLVVNQDEDGICSASGYHYKWAELEYYSTDRKEWKPCVKEAK